MLLTSKLATENNSRLKQLILEKLTSLGFPNGKAVLDQVSNKLLRDQLKQQFNYSQTQSLETMVYKLIYHHSLQLENHPAFQEIVKIMQSKAVKFNCESVLKLILYCDSVDKLKKIHTDLKAAINLIDHEIKKETALDISREEVSKVIGYILSLNLNRCSYTDLLWHAIKNDEIQLLNKAQLHTQFFTHFVTINYEAKKSALHSLLRRQILDNSALLENPLQRDPEEVQVYDQRMVSAQDDKARLLGDLKDKNRFISVVDIGPGGGSIFKSVVNTAALKDPKRIGYYGIELEKNELIDLNNMLKTYRYNNLTASQLLHYAYFINGDALELSKVIGSLNIAKEAKQQYISVILSSVIHEIYSYSTYLSDQNHCDDLNKMTPPIQSRYNMETVYKVYYEGLKSLTENPGGGSLNIRDGVLYKHPDEKVIFTINNAAWLAMFKLFLEDPKYAHLKNQIDVEHLNLHTEISLEAKYVQEYMFKANWGPHSFGNEINEVYCYMTMEDHKKLIARVAKALGIEVEISAEEYSQEGYKQHITNNEITIIKGFGQEKFPPTNMILKITPQAPEQRQTFKMQ